MDPIEKNKFLYQIHQIIDRDCAKLHKDVIRQFELLLDRDFDTPTELNVTIEFKFPASPKIRK